MKEKETSRRKFIKASVTAAAGIGATSMLSDETQGASEESSSDPMVRSQGRDAGTPKAARIRFSVIGINHDHIHGQVGAVLRGGGQFVSFYAKEPDLVGTFAKRYPQVKLARSEKEILEDDAIQLVLGAAIPEDRAPIGLEVMRHGK